jgi:hypothetical protein
MILPSDEFTTESPPADVLVATLLYLMTPFSTTGCPRLREAVIQHLALLHDHPRTRGSRSIRDTTEQLAREWLHMGSSPASARQHCGGTPPTFH